MDESEKQKLYNLIELAIEKNRGKDNYTYPYGTIANLLRQCDLNITKYPYAYARAENKTFISYSFQLNDSELENELNGCKKELVSMCQELLENDYELGYDDDGDPQVEIRYVRTPVTKLPVPPKITFDDCVDIVLKNINDAKHFIFGAVCWITNKKILSALTKKANEGVVVELIADNNNANKRFREKEEYDNLPFPIFYVTDLNKDYWGSNGMMHLKYCLIDSEIALYGTFNWSDHAEINDEDIHEDKNSSSINAYFDEFVKLKSKYKCLLQYPGYFI